MHVQRHVSHIRLEHGHNFVCMHTYLRAYTYWWLNIYKTMCKDMYHTSDQSMGTTLHVCIHIHARIHMYFDYIHMSAYEQTCITHQIRAWAQLCMYAYIFTHIHIFMITYIWMHMYIHASHFVCMHTYSRTYTYWWLHTYECICIYMHHPRSEHGDNFVMRV